MRVFENYFGLRRSVMATITTQDGFEIFYKD